ncbi:small ribosomal subunit protein uS9m [Notothenia coriiceps]|uniref:Small ribosomal subunit protein uS9m n=1 Tax=Notothenia coriiceps TaxID=8208 RepID=A0A6I9NBZ9_9TELE|nr:PREDICTED: 28S ribosomal protein S9, mitochondrial [Notothenia coriiceps]
MFSSISGLGTSRWLTKDELDILLGEGIRTEDYDRFLQLMERLLSLPYCGTEKDFVLSYRRELDAQSSKQTVPTIEQDERGVAYSTSEGRRKTSTSSVVLRDSGSGRIVINGRDYVHYFPVQQDRYESCEETLFTLKARRDVLYSLPFKHLSFDFFTLRTCKTIIQKIMTSHDILHVRRFYPKQLPYSLLWATPTGALWGEVSQGHNDMLTAVGFEPVLP